MVLNHGQIVQFPKLIYIFRFHFAEEEHKNPTSFQGVTINLTKSLGAFFSSFLKSLISSWDIFSCVCEPISLKCAKGFELFRRIQRFKVDFNDIRIGRLCQTNKKKWLFLANILFFFPFLDFFAVNLQNRHLLVPLYSFTARVSYTHLCVYIWFCERERTFSQKWWWSHIFAPPYAVTFFSA